MHIRFSEFIGSFVFHVLVKNEVHRVTSPRYGDTSGQQDGVRFVFSVGTDHKQSVAISISGSQLDSIRPQLSLEVAAVRALVVALSEAVGTIELHFGNFSKFVSDALSSESDKRIRGHAVEYLRSRYDAAFEPPFSVIEMIAALRTTPERTIRCLKYLHKHGFVTFGFSKDNWPEGQSEGHWLKQEFSISSDNWHQLKSYQAELAPALTIHTDQRDDLNYDYFISHSSEDKSAIVEPLAQELLRRGFAVWYDRWVLTAGDSLRRKIDEGLSLSKFGIVVLSDSFFGRHWTETELSGLVQKELGGDKAILPIWHNIDASFVRQHSPTLADRVGIDSSKGLAFVADEIVRASGLVQLDEGELTLPPSSSAPAEVEVGCDRLELRHDCHTYALWLKVALLVPPDQGRLRVRVNWPQMVPIKQSKDIKRRGNSSEFQLDFENRIFPGETDFLIGKHSAAAFIYQVNGDVYLQLERQPQTVEIVVYFEDHPPMQLKIPFTELHVF